MSNLLRIHRMALRLGIYRRSFRVALVVGTLLNLINQPQPLLGLLWGDFRALEHLDAGKALLTYCVPFLVATYSALKALDIRPGQPPNKPLFEDRTR
ncbi:hypothetical protein [Candidatus Methylomicrobium oryzae]|uniref:hypothetical protein n=1 Tax=Candidatus Methylomicrobium oryzae TaxID=2802053 RepID=UPI001920B3AE|nr:hypothetical protein [Methylomicrobium sp. RS1]MBL1262608.1 hypothetical protein [Methylomicrobium sp. RS1]